MLKPTPLALARSPRTRRDRGFTLIELMVALAVAGLLLMGAIPLVREWMMNMQVRNAAMSIAGGLEKARAEAVRRNRDVTFSLVWSNSTSPAGLSDDCTLSSRSASWIISLEDPAGGCGGTLLTGDTSAAVKPRLLARHAQGDGSPDVIVGVYDASCASATGETQVVFNSFGRAATSPAPMRCIVIRHPGSDTTHTLRVMLGTGGSVRTCDPAVTERDDPRTCIPT